MSEGVVQSQISMFIPKMFANACFRASKQWQMYLLMAGWAFPADGALAHSAARRVLGCATAA